MMKKANESKAPEANKPMEQQEDEDAIAERRAIQLSLQQAAHVEAEIKAQQEKKKKEQQKAEPKKEQQKKEQPKPAQPKPEDSELTKKHGDFISEFEKMDEEEDEEAKLKKKQEKDKK